MLVTPAMLVDANVSAPNHTGCAPDAAPIAAGESPRYRDHSVAPVRALNPCTVTVRPLNVRLWPVASAAAVPVRTHRTAYGRPLPSGVSVGHPYTPACRHSNTPSEALTPIVSMALRLKVLADGS